MTNKIETAKRQDPRHLRWMSHLLLWTARAATIAIPYWVSTQLFYCQHEEKHSASVCKPNEFLHWLVILVLITAAVAAWNLLVDLLAEPATERKGFSLSEPLRSRFRKAFVWAGVALAEASLLVLSAL